MTLVTPSMPAVRKRTRRDRMIDVSLHRISAVGDSITAIPGGETGRYAATWFGVFAFLSGGRAWIVGNYAVSGSVSLDVINNQLAAALADASDAVAVLIGTNDCKDGVTTAATTHANITTICDRIVGANKTPILSTIPPLSWQSNATWKKNAEALNAWIRVFAAKNGYPLIDAYAAFADTSGNLTAAYTDDGLHPNTAGRRAFADRAVADVLGRFSPISAHLAAYNTDGLNMIANGLFVLDGDSDGLANSWTKTDAGAVCTTTLATIAGLPGQAQVMTWASAGSATLTQTIATGFSPGDVLRYSGRLWSSGCVAGGLTFTTRLRFSGGVTTDFYPVWNIAPTIDVTDGRWTADVTVPAGSTTCQVIHNGISGAGVIKLGQLTLNNATVWGLL